MPTEGPAAVAQWTTHIARSRAPLDRLVEDTHRTAPPGSCLVLVRSAEARTRWRRRLGPPSIVLTLSEAFGLLGPRGIEDADLLPSVVSHWAIKDSLPAEVRGPRRTHMAHDTASTIALLESNGLRPPYPPRLRRVLDGPLLDAHLALDKMRQAQSAHGRYTPDQRVTLLAHHDDAGTIHRRLSARMPTVRRILLVDVAWMSPAERAALDRLGEAVGAVAAMLVARPADSGDDWSALAHTDTLRAHLAARGPLEDHGDEDDDPRQSVLSSLCHPAPFHRVDLPDVHIDRPADVNDEIRRSTARIHDLLMSGTPPHRIAIVAPDLERYLAPLRETLDAQGVPVSLRHHGHTLHTPAGTLLALLLLDTLDARLERDVVVDWMMHPLVAVHTPGEPGERPIRFAPHRIRDLLGARGLRPRDDGPPHDWDTALDQLLEPDADTIREAERRGETPHPVSAYQVAQVEMARTLVHRLKGLSDAADGLDFLTNLRDLLAHIHLPRTVLRHARALADPQPLLVGYRQLIHLIDEIETAYEVAPPKRRTQAARHVAEALRHGLRSLELPLGGDPEHGVQIVGYRNAPDLDVDHVLVIGATEGKLPAPGATARNARRLRERLGTRHPIARIHEDEEARWILHRLLADTTRTVTISSPESDDGKPVGPSLLLDEINDTFILAPAPDVTGRILTRRELSRQVARTRTVPKEPDALPGLAIQAGLIAERRQSAVPGPYTGAIEAETVAARPELRPLAGHTPTSASRLERAARCGYSSLVHDGLHLRAAQVRDDDLPHLDRGHVLHDILDAYAQNGIARHGAPFRPDPDDSREAAHLVRIANEILLPRRRDGPAWDAFAIQLLGGLDAPANPHHSEPPGLLKRVLDDLHSMPAGDGVLASEATFGDDDAPLAIRVGEETFAFHGRIDRIDRVRANTRDHEGLGLRVIDYKGGSVPLAPHTWQGIDLQLPLYLIAAEALHPNHRAHEGAYYSLKSPRKGEHGVTATRTKTSRIQRADDAAAFDQLLRVDTPRRIVAMRQAEDHGRFPLTWLDPEDAGCAYCDARRVCGMDPDRQTERRLHARTLARDDAATTGYIAALARDDPAPVEEDA